MATSTTEGQTITLTRGEDVIFTLTASSETAIAGWTFALTVATELESASPVITLTGGSGLVVTDADAGIVTATFAATLTDDLLDTGVTYYWDFWRTNSGSKTRLASGKLNVKKWARKPS